jgi:hypothetical protein
MGNGLSAALTSVLIGGLAMGCRITTGEEDGTGGQRSDGQGGSETATSGAGTGGSAATTGGDATTKGGDAATTGEDATTTGGAGGSGPAGTERVMEDCDSTAADNNDTRETAMPLGAGATLCVKSADQDWLYVDAPDDGKAHILRVLIAPDPGISVSFLVEAAADGSSLGNDYTAAGTDQTLWATLGPGTRTLLRFSRFSTGGRFTLEASLEAETDAYSPNYTKETAAEIAVNEEISAEVHQPYTSATDKPYQDWYQVELATGQHTLSFTQVVSSQQVSVRIVDSRGENVGNDYAANAGALFDYEFAVKNAGVHFISVADFRGAPGSFAVGKRRASLSEQYVFSVIE